ncbi:hypothetical protein AC249_AIPGENE20397 [Exaiptasia diaphana]|nr:hypothetical protein AC249_AIPGENE20397 [Exaiptasia diaphana]
MNGAKILSMEVKEQNIKFLDSMAFLPMRLAAKTFGLDELRKDYFPHHFNTTANQSYIGPLPDAFYDPDACNLVFRKNFLQPETIAIIPPYGYTPQDKQSALALKWLSYLAEKENINIRHAGNSGEQRIGPYRVDGFYEGTVWELYGDFWHGHPQCFARETKNPDTGNKSPATIMMTSELSMGHGYLWSF